MKPLVILMLILTCNTLFSKELERVSLQLQWLHQFQFAGFYVAKERGFYEDVGLDLDIIEYNHDINIVDDIHSGKTNYATGRSSLLIHRAHHDDIVLLDAIFEHSPSILISTNPSIKKPSDLKDKQIMITDDQATASSFYAMFLSQGVNPKSIRKQRHSFNLDDLIQGRTDAMACYISNEPYLLDQKGISYSIMNPKDYGYDFYGDLLYSSEQELYAHPKRTEAFVKASRKGWFEAFNNIETTAKLIHEHYNTQNKSLEALIYEGKILKTLWCDNPKKGTVLSFERFQTMAEFYRLNNFLDTYPDLKKFIDPIHFNRSQIKIGILSKRGVTYTIKRWKPTIEHLNFMLPQYHIEIIPLGFEAVNDAIANKSIDFILTNSMQYVQLEAEHGTSRLATLINPSPAGGLSQFGSVIFTHAENREIHTLDDLKNRRFAAVNPYSFGGWIMALKTLIDNAITQEDFSSLAFLHTHDKVVEAVLKRDVDAGTVRTNILEHMAQEGKIDLKDFKILHPQHYDDFPYLLSTELYPEWSFAKLAPTSQVSANALLSELLKLNQEHDKSLTKWSIPINYKPVHDLLKTLEMTPYLRSDITFKQLLEQYRPWLIIALVVFIILIFFLLKIKNFNIQLEAKIKERTKSLLQANKKLHELAEIDELTGATSRREFFALTSHAFDLSKRNHTGLILLALDIDFFKHVNDTYGHPIGDEVLKLFSRTIQKILRRSDLFGRVGGEEFTIALQNIPMHDALILAEKIRYAIEHTPYVIDKEGSVHFSVSIGVSTLEDDDKSLSELIKRSDNALYLAKEEGRNCIRQL